MSDNRYSDLVEEKKLWEGLLSHPAWTKLIGVLQEQADGLQRVVVFTPLVTLDGALAQEFQKGRLSGLLQVSDTINGLVAGLEEEIEMSKVGADDGS